MLALILLGPMPSWAGAVLFIYPTLVIFEGNQRSATVTLTNRGDQTGTFETSWSDMTMTADGRLRKIDEDAPWSVKSYVRHSPRRVTLKPSESQVVRIALRRGQNVPEGEYYSHFRVLTIHSEDPSDDETAASTEAADSPTTVRITARTAIAIPIIWRNSRATPEATIESVDIDREANQLNVEVRRHGNLSVRGSLHVFATAPDGTRHVLAKPVPLIIYPSLERRTIAITLDEGIDAGDLTDSAEVVYAPDVGVVNEGTVFASYPVTP